MSSAAAMMETQQHPHPRGTCLASPPRSVGAPGPGGSGTKGEEARLGTARGAYGMRLDVVGKLGESPQQKG